MWIRSILVFTSMGVSFSHGSNDGQKGVGLVMMILIGIAPAYFAIDRTKSPAAMISNITRIEKTINEIDTLKLPADNRKQLAMIHSTLDSISPIIANVKSFKDIPDNKHFILRKSIILISKSMDKLLASNTENQYKFLNVTNAGN